MTDEGALNDFWPVHDGGGDPIGRIDRRRVVATPGAQRWVRLGAVFAHGGSYGARGSMRRQGGRKPRPSCRSRSWTRRRTSPKGDGQGLARAATVVARWGKRARPLGRLPASVAFDAAGYYDETRALPPTLAATIDLLYELGGSARVLDVGVGTGLLALPLVERGLHVDALTCPRRCCVVRPRRRPRAHGSVSPWRTRRNFRSVTTRSTARSCATCCTWCQVGGRCWPKPFAWSGRNAGREHHGLHRPVSGSKAVPAGGRRATAGGGPATRRSGFPSSCDDGAGSQGSSASGRARQADPDRGAVPHRHRRRPLQLDVAGDG